MTPFQQFRLWIRRAPVGERVAAGVASGTGGGCVWPPGSDQGVSAGQIKIAITLVNIVGPAGNAYFGVPPVEEQQQDYQAVLDELNASGGAACRKLVAQFYTVNPA